VNGHGAREAAMGIEAEIKRVIQSLSLIATARLFMLAMSYAQNFRQASLDYWQSHLVPESVGETQ
jgi:hypothetical protein